MVPTTSPIDRPSPDPGGHRSKSWAVAATETKPAATPVSNRASSRPPRFGAIRNSAAANPAVAHPAAIKARRPQRSENIPASRRVPAAPAK